MANVVHVELPDGSHAIGVGSGKKFVPFATVDADRYRQLEENEFYTAGKASGGKASAKDETGEGGES